MFAKDTRTETFLTQMGVSFVYSNNVKFSELARGWDVNNLARPVPRRENAILEYAALMESGSPAPAPILHKTPNGYRILDGVQRCAAAEVMTITMLSAYLVDSDSEDLLTAINVLANARLQGHPEPPEWTRRQAVEILVIQRGLTAPEVAKMGGWKASDIERLARSMEWGFKIRCIGGPHLPDNMLETIARHTTLEAINASPKPVVEFLESVKKSQLSTDDAQPYIEEFFKPIAKASKSHDILMERLTEFLDEPEIQTRLLGRRGYTIRRDVNLRRTLKAAITVLDEIHAAGDELSYIDEFFRLTKTIDEKLRAMTSRHEPPKTVRVPSDMYEDRK